MCKLLGIEESQMRMWLCHKKIVTVGEVLTKPLTLTQVNLILSQCIWGKFRIYHRKISLYLRQKILISGKYHCYSGKSECISGKSQSIWGKPQCISGKSQYIWGKFQFISDKSYCFWGKFLWVYSLTYLFK